MFEPTAKLETPTSFNFPYDPYESQRDFMSALYSTIENKQIGIFESPTGTGKTLSLLCGAFQWQHDHKRLVSAELSKEISRLKEECENAEIDCTDWIASQAKIIEKKERLQKLQRIYTSMEAKHCQIEEMRKKNGIGIRKTNIKIVKPKVKDRNMKEEEEEDFPAHDVSDDDFGWTEIENEVETDSNLDPDEKLVETNNLQIFFASRTHTQLKQVIDELRKTVFTKTTTVTTLASRRLYCIHPEVSKLTNVQALNEKCKELMSQKRAEIVPINRETDKLSSSKKRKMLQGNCVFNKISSISQLSEQILVETMDIEEVIRKGRSSKACPYYSSRKALSHADFVALPYPLLLHKKMRTQTGINLKNSIIIIDEAHNLLDTISQMHSTELSIEMLRQTHQHLVDYKKQYLNRFHSRSLLKLSQLIFVVNRLIVWLDDICKKKINQKSLKCGELIEYAEIQGQNLPDLLEFCEHTKLAQKVEGFVKHYCKAVSVHKASTAGLGPLLNRLARKPNAEVHQKPDPDSGQWSLSLVFTFMESLRENDCDGRVLVIVKSATDIVLKYINLQPAKHFGELVAACRSLIIAGGTMQPTSLLMSQLFGECRQRVREHFYDHVISPDAVLPIVLCVGPQNKTVNFNFTNRSSEPNKIALMSTIVRTCAIVPGGIICFFSSFDYMEEIYQYILKNDGVTHILKSKNVYIEPRSASFIDKILTDFGRDVCSKQKSGAILFSVMGGKLSEGLNFADDLGRCVILVGLPYANKDSIELRARMTYLDEMHPSTDASHEYYNGICMTSVNQSMGRVIRSITDYAVILLVDDRFDEITVQNYFPAWIKRSCCLALNFNDCFDRMRRFFETRNNVTNL